LDLTLSRLSFEFFLSSATPAHYSKKKGPSISSSASPEELIRVIEFLVSKIEKQQEQQRAAVVEPQVKGTADMNNK
jgi:hypothetical protein